MLFRVPSKSIQVCLRKEEDLTLVSLNIHKFTYCSSIQFSLEDKLRGEWRACLERGISAPALERCEVSQQQKSDKMSDHRNITSPPPHLKYIMSKAF